MKSEQKKNYNRAVVVLVLGLMVALWVMVNAGTYLNASLIYIVIGLVCIFFYWAFPKFGGWI